MGSIADLLGDQLRAGLAQLADAEAPPEDDAPSSGGESASDASERARVIAMEAAVDEAEIDPARVRGRDSLRGDLDLDDISLYALVARIEREAKVTLADAEVETWVSLSDLLDSVSEAASNR